MKSLVCATALSLFLTPILSQAATFDQPVTVKETKNPDQSVTRIYSQGGSVILQQEVGAGSGSIGQLVFYKDRVVVDDRAGSRPLAGAMRTVPSNDLKIAVVSIAADELSPARLRICDVATQEILSEFFIDKEGLMKPVTKAEHDADLALRRQKLAVK
ncbi:hypothetical protein SAMN05444156_1510 [Verrucomicrobium sp. GAS474]|uniref:hypothetical protein n=1 Tax=Verrucomicrobium sp. GAS474 TaxID=1882831 RepID=UPI00087BB71F|nr:hypothetical protein [Verrucomicrobium sp. GAS474]SDU02447.1 hypothetical protein SAMN05444156_1510 [Verrucomicrobium sp. GAS474]